MDPGPNIDWKQGFGNEDFFISTFDSDGNYLWGKLIGGSGNDCAYATGVTSTGDIYITGFFDNQVDFDPGIGTDIHTSFGSVDAFLTKFDKNGYYLGSRTWGAEYLDYMAEGSGLAVSPNNSVYTTGFYSFTVDFDPSSYGTDYQTANGSFDVFLNKL